MLNPKAAAQKAGAPEAEQKTRGKAARANGAATTPTRVAKKEPQVLQPGVPLSGVITAEEYDRLEEITRRAKRHPKLAKLLADSRKHITHG